MRYTRPNRKYFALGLVCFLTLLSASCMTPLSGRPSRLSGAVAFAPETPGTIDLSKDLLDYPNYMPFDRSAMIYIVGAMRGRSMMRKEGTPVVYFDDVEGGTIDAKGNRIRFFFNDFESQTTVGKQPVTAVPIRLDNYRFNHWYLERDEAIIRIEKVPFARSGGNAGVADVNLRD